MRGRETELALPARAQSQWHGFETHFCALHLPLWEKGTQKKTEKHVAMSTNRGRGSVLPSVSPLRLQVAAVTGDRTVSVSSRDQLCWSSCLWRDFRPDSQRGLWAVSLGPPERGSPRPGLGKGSLRLLCEPSIHSFLETGPLKPPLDSAAFSLPLPTSPSCPAMPTKACVGEEGRSYLITLKSGSPCGYC